MAMEKSEEQASHSLSPVFLPPSQRTRSSNAWPDEALVQPRVEGVQLSLAWDEQPRGNSTNDSAGFEDSDGQQAVRNKSRLVGSVGLSGGLIYNNRNSASERLEKFQKLLSFRRLSSGHVPAQGEGTGGPPVAETATRSAMDSWRLAIEFSRKEARAKLDKERREANARQELRRDVWDALKSFVIFAVVVMSLGTVLFLVERDELYERTRDKFVFADRLDAGYCAWMGAVYVGYLSAHRVGYGDILVTTAAGKWLVMLFASLTTPLSVIFTLKCSKLMKRFVGNFSEKYFARHGGKYVDAFYVSTFIAALLILMLANTFFLVTLKGNDGERLTYTDAFWYSWSTYTTVGYGDIGFATLPSVTLFTWAVQYTFFVIGAVLMDTLISCAYSLLVDDDEDELHRGPPESLQKSTSKLALLEPVPVHSQSQHDDTTAASPQVKATYAPGRFEISHIEEP